MLILTVDHTPLLDGDSLLRVARNEFGGDHVSLHYSDSPDTDFQVRVNAPGIPSFRIERSPDGHLNSDGTEEQSARVAAAIRAALPDDFPRLVAVTDSASMYVDLISGITPEMIRNGWRDVSEGGF